MKITKRIIPCFMVFATLLSCFVAPVHAEDGDGNGTDYINKPNFWSWAYQNSDFLQNTVGNIYGDIDHACSQSSDGRHHASGYSKDLGNGTFLCKCNECGENFKAYAKQSYDNTVSEMPMQGLTSDGGFLWKPCVSDYYADYGQWRIALGAHWTNYDPSTQAFNPREYSVYDRYFYGKFGTINDTPRYRSDMAFIAPIEGVYFLVSSPLCSYRIYDNSGKYTEGCVDYPSKAIGFRSVGESVSPGDIKGTVNGASSSPATIGYIYLPVFRIVPTITPSNDAYSIDYRPTSISAPVYYTDNSGQVNVTTGDVHLFSENDMTLTNPQTGTTSTVTDWSYDYSSRTYDLTLDTGEHSTVTYGDENITIKEGDTTYIYNYYVQPSNDDPNGGGNSDPEHKHDYTREITRQASCTVAGQETYTCECGDTYTKSIPALGHDWLIKEQVNSEYDENGEETVKGYTIYKCSRCGEEKRSDDGQPPDSGGGAGKPSIWQKLGDLFGAIGNGLIETITAFIGKILDGLIALAEVIGEKLTAIVEMVLGWFDSLPQMFEGFLAFLASVFGFLPPEIVILMTFGFALVIFIGIIKAIRR